MALQRPASVRYALRQRRPGRQFDFAYWSHFHTCQGSVNPGASYRGWLASDHGHGTPPPPRDRDRRGEGGLGGSGDGRRWIRRLLDLLAVGFRFGAPWAWTAYRTPNDAADVPDAPDTSGIADSAH